MQKNLTLNSNRVRCPPILQVEAKNDQGFTPLILAASSNNLEVVKVLLKYGADINARTDKGLTALKFASDFNQDEKVAELLIKRGARIENINKKKKKQN